MERDFRIAVLLGTDMDAHRRMLQGIQEYKMTGRKWTFRIAWPNTNSLEPLVQWNPDGIIAKLYTAEMIRKVRSLRKPLVNISNISGDKSVVRVGVDEKAIGRMVAEHFLERGFRHFAFVGYRQQAEEKDRKVEFQNCIRRAGYDCSVYTRFDLPIYRRGAVWGGGEQEFQKWLTKLPKPLAVFAYHDLLAWEIAEVCTRSNLKIPEEVSIVGADNDQLFCELSSPSLSSVSYPAERIGWEAARTLDRLLKRKRIERKAVYFPPIAVALRKSSDIVADADPQLARALSFIQEHAGEPIRVKEMLSMVQLSRRSLEQKFKQQLGRSPLQEILRVRVAKASYLLAETKLPVAKIATMSGFSNPERLSVVFKEKTGKSPINYRKSSSIGKDFE